MQQPTILFDANGRRVADGLASAVCKPDPGYYFTSPAVDDLDTTLECFRSHLEAAGIKKVALVSPSELVERTDALVERISKDERISNALKNPWVRVGIPRIPSFSDYGMAFRPFVTAAGSAYKGTFEGRSFNDHRGEELLNQTAVVEASHMSLVARAVQSPLAGIFVPAPVLQGFSVHAQREQMEGFREFPFMSLNGGFDTACAYGLYPDMFGRDGNTPGTDMPAILWRSSENSLSFGANDDRLEFDDRDGLDESYGSFSGGLFFLG